jgi:uncharacterized membrane protein YkoI
MSASRTASAAAIFTALVSISSFSYAASAVATLDKAKLSLHQAIVAAEKTSGGKAVEASLTEKSNAPMYDVKILKDDATSHYMVDASTRDANPTKSDSLMSKVDKEGKSERDAAMTARVPLKDAVATVEKQTGGKAVDAEIDVDGNRAQYVVEVALNGDTMKKTVDASTGKLIAEK